MAPRQPPIIVRTPATGSPTKRTTAPPKPPKAKRQRTFGARSDADASARLIAAQHAQEHSGEGQSYLSVRSDPTLTVVRPLVDIALHASASGLLQRLKVPTTPPGATPTKSSSVKLFGWDPAARQNAEHSNEEREELAALRDFVEGLPSKTANRLLALVLHQSSQEILDSTTETGVSVLALATLFLHPNTTKLSLSALSAPLALLSKIPNCTHLTDLDLSTHTSLKDETLARIVGQLHELERLILRGCTRVGDASVVAVSKAALDHLKVVNLSLTAVTIKGLTGLFARCRLLEVLKLANVAGLNEKAISKLIDDATSGAQGWRHTPLSHLRTLKLRSTELTESSLSRLLVLCAPTLSTLDISYTSVKSLDLLALSLDVDSPLPLTLSKLVLSGLPLSPATLTKFFTRLAALPPTVRGELKKLKLGALPSISTKSPGLTDALLEKLVPLWETLDGLESVSLYRNRELGKRHEPLARFVRTIGRRCTMLDLTLQHLNSRHLDGLLPLLPFEIEDSVGLYNGPPRLETLVLDSSKLTDDAAEALANCKELQGLHVAETRISTTLLLELLQSCPRLSRLNLTSCRGVPVVQRRTFFEAWKRGEIVAESGP